MDKTLDFTIGEEKVLVDTLPKEIRDEVDFFDRMREDYMEVAYNQSVLNVAITAMRNKIVSDVVQHLGLGQQQKAAEEVTKPADDGFQDASGVEEPSTDE